MTYTLERALEDYLRTKSNVNTRNTYANSLRADIAYIGPRRAVSDLRMRHIVEWIGKMVNNPEAVDGKPYAPNTKIGKLKFMRAFLNHLHKIGETEERLSEVIAIPVSPQPDARKKAYTNETFDKLIRYAAGVLPNSRRKLRLLALLLLAHDTGVRRGSLAIMQRQDFTFTEEGGWLLVWNTKRDRSYTSVFGAYTAGILQEWFERLPDDPAAYLWRNDASGAKLSAGAISKAIREACHAVDVEPLGVHGTRRKVGVDMADAGYSAFFISGILDDSVEVVLRHYMPRVSPEAIAAVKTRAYVPPTERKLVNIKDVG